MNKTTRRHPLESFISAPRHVNWLTSRQPAVKHAGNWSRRHPTNKAASSSRIRFERRHPVILRDFLLSLYFSNKSLMVIEWQQPVALHRASWNTLSQISIGMPPSAWGSTPGTAFCSGHVGSRAIKSRKISGVAENREILLLFLFSGKCDFIPSWSKVANSDRTFVSLSLLHPVWPGSWELAEICVWPSVWLLISINFQVHSCLWEGIIMEGKSTDAQCTDLSFV